MSASAVRRLVAASVIALLAVSCGESTGLPHTIDGVGVGSSCDFGGDFEGVFPCETWQGSIASFESVTLAFTNLSKFDGLGIGIASTKPLRSITSPNAVQSQVDGTLGVIEIDGPSDDGVFVLELEAEDGSTTQCYYDVSDQRPFHCDDWS